MERTSSSPSKTSSSPFLIILYNSSSSRRLATSPSPNPTGKIVAALLALVAASVALFTAPASVLAAAQLCTLPLSLFSKLPQILQNHRTRSTGQLSTFAVISQIGGCAARLFTTSQEVNDPLMAAGFALALHKGWASVRHCQICQVLYSQ